MFFGVTRDNQKKAVRDIRGEDFHYQNQTDEPEDVTDEQWKERERVWDKLLPGSGNPSEHGFSFDLITKRRALEILFAQLRIAIPPTNQPTQDGKPSIEWGPEATGLFVGQDAEWAWRNRGQQGMTDLRMKLTHSWIKPFDAEEESLSSACL